MFGVQEKQRKREKERKREREKEGRKKVAGGVAMLECMSRRGVAVL